MRVVKNHIMAYRSIPLFVSLIFLIAIIVSAYFPVLNNEFVNWDDDINIYRVLTYQMPDALRRIWFSFEMPSYLPITDCLWYLQTRLWGTEPVSAFYFHMISLWLHVFNIMLVFILLRKFKIDFFSAWWIALFYGIHPLKVSNVAWVTEQKSLLSGIFVFSSWIFYINHQKQKDVKNYFLSLLFYLFSLLAKPTAIVLPFMYFIMDWYHDKTISFKKNLLKKVPFFFIALIIIGISYFREIISNEKINFNYVSSFMEQIILFSRIIFHYLYQFLFPVTLLPLYPKWDTGVFEISNLFSVIVLSGILLFCLISFLKRKYYLFVFSVSGYLLFILPVSGFIKMQYFWHSFVADRYMYFSQLFLSVFLVLGIQKLKNKWLSLLLLIVLALGCVVKTNAYIPVWKNGYSLWKFCVGKKELETNAVVNNNMGVIYEMKGDLKKSKFHLEKAVSLNPDYFKFWITLAQLNRRNGNVDSAIRNFKKSVELMNHIRHVDYARVNFLIGKLYAKKKSFEKSIYFFKQSLKSKPEQEHVLFYSGITYYDLKDYGRAESCFLKVLKINPDHLAANYNLGNILSKRKQYQQSIRHYKKVLKQNPYLFDCHLSLGFDYLESGAVRKSLYHLNFALKHEVVDPFLYQALSRAYFKLNDLIKAEMYNLNFERSSIIQVKN